MKPRYVTASILFASALAAGPVLAQTAAPMAGPATGTAAPAMPAPGAMATTGSSNTYVTADQQIRASKVIGSSVYNDQKQKIGSVDELLMNQDHDVTSAVISVGGFLGMGSKLVKVPYSQLQVAGDTIVMPGANKDQLTQMPSYSFSANG